MTKKMHVGIGLLAALVGAQVAPAPLAAAELSVDEIVAQANHAAYYQGRDGKARVNMVIRDSQGRERQREFTMLRLDAEPESGGPEDGDQRFYVFFHLPADVNKMVFMVHKRVGGDDDRWLYMPALDLVKRIASAEKRTSFVGSHFFYEDVSGRNVNDDDHELLETTKEYYVLKNTPKDPKSVEFSYYKMWVHRASMLTVKVEFYDGGGEHYRTYEAQGVEQIQGHWTVTKASMQDLRTKGETLVDYRGVAYDIGIPESIFAERYLRRPPRKFLK